MLGVSEPAHAREKAARASISAADSQALSHCSSQSMPEQTEKIKIWHFPLGSLFNPASIAFEPKGKSSRMKFNMRSVAKQVPPEPPLPAEKTCHGFTCLKP